MEFNEFDSYLKRSFENLEIEPSDDIWSKIEKNLKRKRRNKLLLFTSLSGIAASLLFLFTINHLITVEADFTPKNQLSFSIPINNSNFNSTVFVNKPVSELITINESKRIYLDSLCSYKNIECTVITDVYKEEKIDIIDERLIIRENISKIKEKRKIEIGFNSCTENIINSGSGIESQPLMMRASMASPLTYSNNALIPKYKSKLHTNINLRISYPISNKFSIVSGLGYLGFKSRMEDSYFSGNISNFFTSNIDLQDINNGTIEGINQDFAYLELPLLLKYSIVNKKISIYLNAGVGLNYLIQNSSELHLSNNKSIKTSSKNIKTYNSCGLASIGASTPIYKSLSINIEGQLRYFFSDISSNNIFETKQSMPSVSFGLSYRL